MDCDLTMTEALSTALPMFLTDAPGFRFLKELGFAQINWLADPEDPAALRISLEEALGAWAQQPSRILGEQRELACRLFSQDVQIEKLIDLYEDPPA